MCIYITVINFYKITANYIKKKELIFLSVFDIACNFINSPTFTEINLVELANYI